MVLSILTGILRKVFRYVFIILSPRFFASLILTFLYPVVSIAHLVEGEGPSVDDIFITFISIFVATRCTHIVTIYALVL